MQIIVSCQSTFLLPCNVLNACHWDQSNFTCQKTIKAWFISQTGSTIFLHSSGKRSMHIFFFFFTANFSLNTCLTFLSIVHHHCVQLTIFDWGASCQTEWQVTDSLPTLPRQLWITAAPLKTDSCFNLQTQSATQTDLYKHARQELGKCSYWTLHLDGRW